MQLSDITSISIIEDEENDYEDINQSTETSPSNNVSLSPNDLDETIENHNREELDEINEYDIDEFRTIHPNLSCSVKEAVAMIHAFSIRHNLNWEATEDVAHMINTMIGTDKIPSSKYMFKKAFDQRAKTDPTTHFLCSFCGKYLGTEKYLRRADETVCQNCQTEICLDTKYKKNHFTSIPIEYHLKNLLEQNSEFLCLNYDASTTIRDVHDSSNFQNLKEKMQGSPYITLTMNSDGAAVFKATKEKSFWPVQFYVNEIQLDRRFKRQNMICSTFAFGKTPNMQIFLKPLIDEIKTINEKGGIAFKHANGEVIRAIIIPMLVTADALAKAYMLNLVQHMGHKGCPYCLHEGTILEGTTQIRYCNRHNARCRTNNQVRNDMIQAHTSGQSVNGYRGISALVAFGNSFDIVWQVVIDKMHCIDMGVVKKLFNLFLHNKNRNER